MIVVELDDTRLFLHEDSYCIKTVIAFPRTVLTIGYNPSSTLYSKDDNSCAWYMTDKIAMCVKGVR